jgi:predicted AAA+ superfamily ATPase
MPLIITGLRRCGKSSLLRLIKDDLNLKEKEFLYINFNDERLISFENENFQDILDYLGENDYNKKIYLFLDEFQEVENWEKWVDRIKKKFSIIITGSNSQMLSSEISSILTGRSININLFPFSFEEYLNYKKIVIKDINLDKNLQNKIKRYFNEFLLNGGLPKMILNNEKIILRELYENIIYRDIIRRLIKI